MSFGRTRYHPKETRCSFQAELLFDVHATSKQLAPSTFSSLAPTPSRSRSKRRTRSFWLPGLMRHSTVGARWGSLSTPRIYFLGRRMYIVSPAVGRRPAVVGIDKRLLPCRISARSTTARLASLLRFCPWLCFCPLVERSTWSPTGVRYSSSGFYQRVS